MVLRTRSLVLPTVLLAALAAGAVLYWGSGRPAPATAAAPPLPEPEIAQLAAQPVAPRLGSFSAAEARAYALLGQLDDHRIAALPTLDAETRAALPRARELLARQQQLLGGGTPTRIGGGAMAVAPAGTIPPASIPAAGGPAARGGDGGGGADRSASGTAPLAAGAVAHELGPHVAAGGVALTASGHEITGSGTWAALHYVPGQGPEPVISDHGQGGYAIALFPEDSGSTRLNGGMIVPGRFYQVTGAMHVTGSAPIDVHVRPLSAVPSYAPLPCLPPMASG